MKQETRNGQKGVGKSVLIVWEVDPGLEMGFVEQQPEDLGVVLVEFWLLLLGFRPGLGVVPGIGAVGSSNRGSEPPTAAAAAASVVVSESVGVDVGEEALEESNVDLEEGED